MGEIKVRIEAINAGTSGRLPIPPPLVKEVCYLQFRMICELVALGCLTAHGDISATKSTRLQERWEADKIIEALEALHPNFFPMPVVQAKEEKYKRLDPLLPNPMPKADFLKLYHKCGETLHRGSVRKLISQKGPVVIHYPDITAIAQKFVDMLSVHQVSMLGGKMHFICILYNPDPKVDVQVAIAEASGPPPGWTESS